MMPMMRACLACENLQKNLGTNGWLAWSLESLVKLLMMRAGWGLGHFAYEEEDDDAETDECGWPGLGSLSEVS